MLSPNTIYLLALKKYILDNLILLKETKHHSDSQIMSLTVNVRFMVGGGTLLFYANQADPLTMQFLTLMKNQTE